MHRGATVIVLAAAGPAAGLRVLDFGQYVAGPLAGMLLADAGAEVTKIDPPGGARGPYPASVILQRGKTLMELDLHRAEDRGTARRLAASADVLIENFRPGVMDKLGLGQAETRAGNPGLVYLSLPGFGVTDPRAGEPGWEGLIAAATGTSDSAPADIRISGLDPASLRPSISPVTVASNFAAIIGANCTLAALIERERSGAGQWIEVPLYDATFEAIGRYGQRLLDTDPGEQGFAASDIIARCSDGRYLYLILHPAKHIRAFVTSFLPDAPIALRDKATLVGDPAAARDLRDRVLRLLATRPANEWDAQLNAAGIPAALVQSSAEWLADPHAQSIAAVTTVPDEELGPTVQAGFPVLLSRTPLCAHSRRTVTGGSPDWSSRSGRPRNAPSAAARTMPLAGIRVIDTTQILAGPTAGRILAELGAEVIKLNSPAQNITGHVHVNSGKASTLVNLGSPEGREVLWRMCDGADVFMQNLAGDCPKRLGITEDDVRSHAPGIIYAQLSAYGPSGPRRGYRGWEPVGQALTGMMLQYGSPQPRFARYMLCDYGAGHLLAYGILLALYHRQRTGEAQRVDTSLVHAGTFQQMPYLIGFPDRNGPRVTTALANAYSPDGYRDCDRLYQASDRWIHVVATRTAIADALGLAEEGQRPIEQVLADEPAHVLLERLAAAGIPAQLVAHTEEVMESPVARNRGLSIVRAHPGIGRARTTGPGPRLTGTPIMPAQPVGWPGSDTRAVLSSVGLADRLPVLTSRSVVADRLVEGTELRL